MSCAGDLERWFARKNAQPLPRARHLRLFGMAMATLPGWLAGTTLGGSVMAMLVGLEPEAPWLPWRVAAMISTLGCGIAFPLALVWLALFLRPHAAVLRIEVAPGFGAACGAALAFGLFAPAGAVLLGFQALIWHMGLGTLVGATTWTTYVLLARWLAAHAPGEGSSG